MNTQIRHGLPPLPPTMRQLPVDPKTGFPVPFFVFWKDGVPDFRVSDVRKMLDCVKRRTCMICDKPLAGEYVFAMPPINAMNLLTDEPPMHWACAEWSAQVCPWMLKPSKLRNDARPHPEGTVTDGVIKTNYSIQYRNEAPSVWTLMQTDMWWLDSVSPDRGMSFMMGAPSDVRWYCQGRRATREEVTDTLRDAYQRQMEVTPPEHYAEVESALESFTMWLPEAE